MFEKGLTLDELELIVREKNNQNAQSTLWEYFSLLIEKNSHLKKTMDWGYKKYNVLGKTFDSFTSRS
jgi:hypothetical protein